MPRKRLLAPEFFTHADLFDAEAASQLPLRLAFAALWCQADRRGVFAWRPRELKLACLPYDAVDFEAVLSALEAHGFVRRYTSQGRRFGVIPTFTRWQSFHRDERPSDAPGPDAADPDSADRADAASAVGSDDTDADSVRRVGADPTAAGPDDANADFARRADPDSAPRVDADSTPTPGQHGATTVPPRGQHHSSTPASPAVTASPAVAISPTATAAGVAAPVNAADAQHRKRLVIAANKGVTALLGYEDTTPMRWDTKSTREVADRFTEHRVELAFAESALFELASTRMPSDGIPARSLRYFADAVIRAWRAEEAHRLASAAEAPSAIATTPKSASAARSTPATPPISEAEQLRAFAVQYAQAGNPEWIAHCEAHGIDWSPA